MQERANIIDHLSRAYAGGAWHGPALGELLADVSAEQAAARPMAEAHSIWELVLHIAAWNNVFCRRLEEHPTETPEEGDFPPVEETTEEAWAQARARLAHTQQQLLQTVSALPDSRLSEQVIGKDYSLGFMLLGIIQHNVYHAGQIALLKKARADSHNR